MKYYVLTTPNSNEVAEKLGFNISGLRFKIMNQLGDEVRGYVVMDLGLGTATIDRGPIWLKMADLEERNG